MWLENSDESGYIHETQSELGDHANNIPICTSRKAMQKECKTDKAAKNWFDERLVVQDENKHDEHVDGTKKKK